MGIFARAVTGAPGLKGFDAGTEFIRGLDLGGILSATGETIDRDKAMRYSAFYAAVTYLAQDLAKLSLKVYQRLPDGGRRLIDGSPSWQLLHRPHQEYTTYRWRETMAGHRIVAGNAYAAIGRDGTGRVRELQPLRPDRMEVSRGDAGRRLYRYEHSQLGVVELDESEVFHWPGYGWDGLQGQSLLSVMRDAIALGRAHEQFGTSFFRNGLRPSVVATHPKTLSDPAAARLRDAIEARHSGVGKSFRVLLLEEDVKVTTIGISPEDAQFLEGREFQVLELARFTRMPPHKLMVNSPGSVSYSSVEERNRDYVTDTLQSHTESFEQEVARQLLPPDEYIKLDLRSLLRGNTAARTAYYTAGLNGKWLVPNEVRSLEDFDPVEWGDDPIETPNNSASADTLRDRIDMVGVLVGSGFEPRAALTAVGLDPIEHIGLLPVTLQPEG